MVAVSCFGADNRPDLEASAFFGLGIDSFSAAEQKLYLNPDSAAVKQERAVAGFDFAYRLADAKGYQLWVYGQSMHGMRSEEIDCSANPGLFACQSGLIKPPAGDLLYMIRNASSLEGHAGLRFELLRLNRIGMDPASVYLKAEAGFLDIAGGSGVAMGAHQIAIGAIATGGFFQGSYVEGGWGRSDVFVVNRYRRKKVDALLTWPLKGSVRAFMEMTVDTDLGRGSDSIQSFVGVEVDLRNPVR